ncbi:hypothetical protein MRX96_006762 [Rhipicephalus microplus]|uniref:uncharacterized protein LOC119175724 isoform X1 n=1 Tax=Rhipicephalus microplus TaxID=6941 RepID=UPI003F6BF3D8
MLKDESSQGTGTFDDVTHFLTLSQHWRLAAAPAVACVPWEINVLAGDGSSCRAARHAVMQLPRWLLACALVSLAAGVTGIVLRRWFRSYAIGDILCICGMTLFTTILASIALKLLGRALKRRVACSRFSEILGVVTLRSGTQLVEPQDVRLLPAGTLVCVVPPTQPVFYPDNAGDMLTIFEDYAQFPQQPPRMFDTHRLSPVSTANHALERRADTPPVVITTSSSEGSTQAEPPTTSEEDDDVTSSSDRPPSYAHLCGEPPPPYKTDSMSTLNDEIG